jgi:hypothetical protein
MHRLVHGKMLDGRFEIRMQDRRGKAVLHGKLFPNKKTRSAFRGPGSGSL